jgi:hypothetical protein
MSLECRWVSLGGTPVCRGEPSWMRLWQPQLEIWRQLLKTWRPLRIIASNISYLRLSTVIDGPVTFFPTRTIMNYKQHLILKVFVASTIVLVRKTFASKTCQVVNVGSCCRAFIPALFILVISPLKMNHLGF